MKSTMFLAIVLFCTVESAFAQQKSSEESRLIGLARKAAIFSYNYAQEKAYLHFDNTGYFLGETIWFKAYVVDAMNNTPSTMSKTLYVELLTPNGELVHSKKLMLNNGVARGDLYLPDSLIGGFYEVRAYTRSMLNFGDEVVFSRVLPIYNAPIDEGNYKLRVMTDKSYKVSNYRQKSEFEEKLNLAFFPEGGNLVKGVPCNVAFKATDKAGHSIEVSGTLYDSEKRKLGTLKTVHEGMGVFSFTPDSGNYVVSMEYNDKEYRFTFPEVLPNGYVMNLLSDATANPKIKNIKLYSDSVAAFIQRSPNQPGNDSLALVVTCRGKLMDLKLLTVPANGIVVNIARNSLAEGVNQVTLYNTDGLVQSERLYFVAPETVPKQSKNRRSSVALLNVRTDKNQYKPYERIRMEMSAADTENTQTGTSISVAVRDAATSNFSGPDIASIATNLLLSSDLKGYIAQPTWYFEQKDKQHLNALDLLMLTQGWRRYRWERMDGAEAFEPVQPIEDGLIVDGEVRSVFQKKPVPNIDLTYWMTRGRSSVQGQTRTDSLGRYSFRLDPQFDDWNLNIYTSKGDTTKDYRILINRQFAPAPRALLGYDKEVWITTDTHLPKSALDSSSALLGKFNYITETNPSNPQGWKEYELKEIVKTAQRPVSFIQDVERRTSVRIDVDKKISNLEDVGESELTSLTEFIFQQNKSIGFANNYENNAESSDDNGDKLRYKGRPAIFIFYANDVKTSLGYTKIYDENIKLLTPRDVEKFLIVEDHDELNRIDPALYYEFSQKTATSKNPDPVIIYVFLKQARTTLPMGVRNTSFQAYSRAREFYSPIYPAGQPVLDPDYRRTLYWNSDVILDKTGKAQLEFYNNGTSKKLIISTEGITSNGVLLVN